MTFAPGRGAKLEIAESEHKDFIQALKSRLGKQAQEHLGPTRRE